MKKKRPVKLIVPGLFTVLAAAVVISVLVASTAAARRSDNINEQLFLGIRYLSENNYEAAVVYFDQVLEIDSRNVPAYIGNALAYEHLGDREKELRTLIVGIENTDNDVLITMMTEAQAGEKLTERYNMVEADTELNIINNPFETLEILSSDYYQWDFNACAALFGFRYESYAGQKVDLGNYKGLDMQFDATQKNVEFVMENEDYTYGYKLLSDSQLQMFHIDCTGKAVNKPALSEVNCSLEMGYSYNDTLEDTGLEALESGTFYIAESNIGVVGYIQWQEADSSNLYLYLSERNPLGLRLSFQRGRLISVLYTCEVPDNLRSKAIGWIGNMVN